MVEDNGTEGTEGADLAVRQAVHRDRIRRVRSWALQRGRSVDAEALTVIVLAKEECFDAPLDLWALDDLAELIWTELSRWCAAYEVPMRPGLAEALWLYLTFLGDAGQLDERGDGLVVLRTALAAYGGLDHNGRPRAGARHASRRRRAQSPATASLAQIVPLRPGPRPHTKVGA